MNYLTTPVSLPEYVIINYCSFLKYFDNTGLFSSAMSDSTTVFSSKRLLVFDYTVFFWNNWINWTIFFSYVMKGCLILKYLNILDCSLHDVFDNPGLFPSEILEQYLNVFVDTKLLSCEIIVDITLLFYEIFDNYTRLFSSEIFDSSRLVSSNIFHGTRLFSYEIRNNTSVFFFLNIS